jgi:hypothetical protein
LDVADESGRTSIRFSAADLLVDPLKDQVGNLKVVLVHHHHVAVAANTALGLAGSRLPVARSAVLLQRCLDAAEHEHCRRQPFAPGRDVGKGSIQHLQLAVG